MKRMMLAGLAVAGCLALLAGSVPAKAMMIAPPSLPQRVATADMIVVGKVTGFTDKLVSAPRFPGDREKGEYQVAIVKIEQGLVGARDVKEIKVGFLPPPPPPQPGVPGGPIRIGPRRPRTPTLALGQEACLFLARHPSADFYTMPAYFSVLNKQGNAGFEKEIEEIKRCAKLLADPKPGLESKDGAERLLTAGLLISHYRNRKPGVEMKTEPVDAKLSKQILLTLADSDWNARIGRPGPGIQMTPQSLFFQLGLTPADGWTQPKDFKQLPEAARKWLKDNAGTYRIQRFVAAKAEKEEKKD
jgi:hypothetical protein